MTRKERVRKAIGFETADIVPYHIHFTPGAVQKISDRRAGDFSPEEVGNHVAEVYAAYRLEDLGNHRFRDEFGTVWERNEDVDIGMVVEAPLKEASLDGYKFPDPCRPERFADIPAQCERNSELFIAAGSTCLFEKAWYLRGFDNFLTDLAAEPEFANKLLDAILEYNLAFIGEFIKQGVDAVFFGDDYAHQHGMLMRPATWREYFKPRLARMFRQVRQAGLPVFLHCCGDMTAILDDLVEIGLNVLQPCQPESLDLAALKKRYRNKLCFWGGIGTQRTLPFGTPDQVKQEVRERIRTLGESGGYIIGTGHSVQKDVPVENILALIEAVRRQ